MWNFFAFFFIQCDLFIYSDGFSFSFWMQCKFCSVWRKCNTFYVQAKGVMNYLQRQSQCGLFIQCNFCSTCEKKSCVVPFLSKEKVYLNIYRGILSEVFWIQSNFCSLWKKSCVVPFMPKQKMYLIIYKGVFTVALFVASVPWCPSIVIKINKLFFCGTEVVKISLVWEREKVEIILLFTFSVLLVPLPLYLTLFLPFSANFSSLCSCFSSFSVHFLIYLFLVLFFSNSSSLLAVFLLNSVFICKKKS